MKIGNKHEIYGFCHAWIIRVGHHFEHLGVAMYSMCEICGMHSGMWWVSLALVFLGSIGFLYEWLSGDTEAATAIVNSIGE